MEREKERKKRDLGFKQNIQIMLKYQTKVNVALMNHAELEIMQHAAVPGVGL